MARDIYLVDIHPRSSTDDQADCVRTDAVILGEAPLAYSPGGVLISDRADIIGGQCQACGVGLSPLLAIGEAPALGSICHVLSVRPRVNVQGVRAYAGWVVTLMQQLQSIRYRPVGQFPSEFVSTSHAGPLDRDHAVSARIATTLVFPTTLSFLYSIPKRFNALVLQMGPVTGQCAKLRGDLRRNRTLAHQAESDATLSAYPVTSYAAKQSLTLVDDVLPSQEGIATGLTGSRNGRLTGHHDLLSSGRGVWPGRVSDGSGHRSNYTVCCGTEAV